MKTIRLARLAGILVAVVAAPSTVLAQGELTLNGVAQRLEQVERQNAELREQLGLLRQELDRVKQVAREGAPSTARIDALEEKGEVSAGRLSEQDAVKVEGSQRAPLRVTGMVLFDAYANGRFGGPADYPGIAVPNRGPSNSGASLRGSIIGLAFDAPQAVLGGQFHGLVLFDLFATGNSSLATGQLFLTPRLRTAFVEGRWGTRSVLVGQDKVIFSPLEPQSLAARVFSPLNAGGNLYGWRPQVRFEQKVGLGARQEVRAQIGAVETFEDWPLTQPEFVSTLALRRPAVEGRFQFAHRFDGDRRFEIASGFHRSTTHVAQTSIPAAVVSVDGFIKPLRRLELTGFAYTGKNVGTMSGRNFYGFTIRTPRPGQVVAIAVRQRGGWAQATLLATPRLTFHVQTGMENPNDDDVIATAIVKNAVYVSSVDYRVAPNVISGFEYSQVRTRYKTGQSPRNNHYDLYLAYLF